MTISEQIQAFCEHAQKTIPGFVYSVVVETNTGEVLGKTDAGLCTDVNYEVACCAAMTKTALSVIQNNKGKKVFLNNIIMETDSCSFYVIMTPENKYFYSICYLREQGNLGLAMASLNSGKELLTKLLE